MVRIFKERKATRLALPIKQKNIANRQYISSHFWKTYTKDQIKSVRDTHELEEYMYVEVLLDWLSNNNVPNEVVYELWNTINQSDICFEYISHVKYNIIKGRNKLGLNIEDENLHHFNEVPYKYSECAFPIDLNQKTMLRNNEPITFPTLCTTFYWHEDCPFSVRNIQSYVTTI